MRICRVWKINYNIWFRRVFYIYCNCCFIVICIYICINSKGFILNWCNLSYCYCICYICLYLMMVFMVLLFKVVDMMVILCNCLMIFINCLMVFINCLSIMSNVFCLSLNNMCVFVNMCSLSIYYFNNLFYMLCVFCNISFIGGDFSFIICYFCFCISYLFLYWY